MTVKCLVIMVMPCPLRGIPSLVNAVFDIRGDDASLSSNKQGESAQCEPLAIEVWLRRGQCLPSVMEVRVNENWALSE